MEVRKPGFEHIRVLETSGIICYDQMILQNSFFCPREVISKV